MFNSDLQFEYPGNLHLKASYTIDHAAEQKALEAMVEHINDPDANHKVAFTIAHDGQGTMTVSFDLTTENHVKHLQAQEAPATAPAATEPAAAPAPPPPIPTVQEVIQAGYSPERAQQLVDEVTSAHQKQADAIAAEKPEQGEHPALPSAADLDAVALDPTTAGSAPTDAAAPAPPSPTNS